MLAQISLHAVDLAVFALYMMATVALGFWVARKGKDTTQSYFLGNRTIPWFVVGSSMVAADISSEQFISNVSIAYQQGIVPAAGDWNAWIIYSLLILIFLPYYVRTGIYTMPEFLERRYNSACRYIFAVASVVGFVAAINAGALYSGGIMLDSFFGDDLARLMPNFAMFGAPISPVIWYIIFFAVTTGVYTIYGGLKSAAWTDFMQIIILGFGLLLLLPQLAGLLVTRARAACDMGGLARRCDRGVRRRLLLADLGAHARRRRGTNPLRKRVARPRLRLAPWPLRSPRRRRAVRSSGAPPFRAPPAGMTTPERAARLARAIDS